MIVRTISENVRSYEQIVEVCCLCCLLEMRRGIYLGHRIVVGIIAPTHRRATASQLLLVSSKRVCARSHSGHFQRVENTPGNLSLSWCIARQLMSVTQVGVIFLQGLNHFQRYAYVRQAYARECRAKEGLGGSSNNHLVPPPPLASRTPSNRSEISLGGF